eukprot:3907849-Amphidinium_carterae.1
MTNHLAAVVVLRQKQHHVWAEHNAQHGDAANGVTFPQLQRRVNVEEQIEPKHDARLEEQCADDVWP